MEPFQPLQLLRRYRAHLAVTAIYVLSPASLFLWKMLAARALSPFYFGVLMFTFSSTNLFTMLISGYRLFFYREVAKGREERAKRILGIMVLSTFLAITGFLILSLIADSARPLLLTLALFALPLTFAATTFYYWQGKRAFRTLTRYALAKIFTFVLFSTAVYLFTPSPLSFLLAYIFPSFVYALSKEFYQLIRSTTFQRVLPLALAGIPFLFLTSTHSIFTNVDTVMLTAYINYAVAGKYRAAASLSRITLMLASAALATYVPTLAKTKEKKRFLSASKKYAFFLTALIIPTGMLFIIFPETILTWTMGSAYVEAATVLRILGVFSLIHALFALFQATLLVLDGEKLLACAQGVGAAANIALNALLIPVLGMMGAAVATGLSYLLADGLTGFWALKLFRQHFKGEA